MQRLLLATLFVALALPGAALAPSVFAQSIPVKTVPVAEGDQFLLFPSQNESMGGVSIALEDPLADPFVNPAKGIRTEGAHVSLAPVYYGFSADQAAMDDGSGRTLPMSALARSGHYFGGAALAWQELVLPQLENGWLPQPAREAERSQDNLYAFGMGGLQIPGTNLSVAASALVARLNGIEGVRMLYAQGSQVDQSGTMGLYRLGLYRHWTDGRSAEAVFMHHRFSMEHDMLEWQGGDGWEREGTWAERTEEDRTLGWALRLGYQHPLSNGWRLGAQATGDWKWHPKIPNYDLMQIPRDPGRSEAYNIGIGVARKVGPAAFGLDLIYEPIWSHTWADALEDTETNAGGLVRAGQMTVENHFRFHNARLKMGARREAGRFDFALGLDAHRIRYHLDQQNFVQVFEREMEESWTEWTFTTGLGLRFPEFTVRYQGALTLGTGQPSTRRFVAETADFAMAARADYIIAPNGALTLDEARVFTHQVSVTVPLTR